MNGVRIVKNKSGDKARPRLPFVVFACLLCGTFGYLLFFGSLPDVIFDPLTVFMTALISCAIAYASYNLGKLFFGIYTAAAVVFTAVFTAMHSADITGIIPRISDALTGISSGAILADGLAVPLAALLPCIIAALETLSGAHFLLCGLTVAAMLVMPFFGVRLNVETIILLGIFMLAYNAVNVLSRREKTPAVKKNPAVMFIAGALILCAAVNVCGEFADSYYDTVGEAERYVYLSTHAAPEGDEDPITGGYINTGNNYRTRAVHLQLFATEKPTETLYLRGFSGGEYTGGDWIRSSDEALLEKMTGYDWSPSASTMYYDMFYNLNLYTERNKPPTPIILTICHKSGKYGNAYVPYYSLRSGYLYDYNGFERLGYVYLYYEQKDMNIDRDNLVEDFKETSEIYSELLEEYIKQINDVYTRVPTEKLPRLTALVKDPPSTVPRRSLRLSSIHFTAMQSTV